MSCTRQVGVRAASDLLIIHAAKVKKESSTYFIVERRLSR